MSRERHCTTLEKATMDIRTYASCHIVESSWVGTEYKIVLHENVVNIHKEMNQCWNGHEQRAYTSKCYLLIDKFGKFDRCSDYPGGVSAMTAFSQ